MRAAHRRPRPAAVVDAVERLAGRLPATSLGRRLVLRRRRVLPAGRPAVPARPRPTRASPMHEDGIGMARTFELEFARPRRDVDATGVRTRASSPSVDGAPADGYRAAASPTAARRLARPRSRCGRAATRARRHPHRRATARAVLAPLRRRARPRRRPGRPGRATSSSAATSAVTGLLVGEDLARVLADRARRPPLPAARRLPVAAAGSSTAPRPTTCPARSRSSHRRPSRCAPRSSAPSMSVVRAARRRRSSAGPTSASRRWSTASSAAARRDRRGAARASPATARSVEAEWHGAPFRLVDTGGWLPGGSDLDDEGQPPESSGPSRDADVVLFVVDVTVGVTDEDERGRRAGCARPSTPVLVVANKVDDDRPRGRRSGSSCALGLGEPCPVSALHGRGTGDLLDALVAALPDAEPTTTPTATRPTPTATPRTRHRLGRHRRPAQRRQVDAVQPARSARTARSSTTCRAPPATRSTPRRDRRRAVALRRHRRHAPQEPDRRAAPSTTRSCGRCRRSTTPTSPCS